MGTIGDKDTENEVLLLEHDVPHSNFSEAVLSCLPKLPWVITEEVRTHEMEREGERREKFDSHVLSLRECEVICCILQSRFFSLI